MSISPILYANGLTHTSIKRTKLEVLQSFLRTLPNIDDFSERIGKLKKFCTQTQNPESWRLKLDYNGKQYGFVLYMDTYKSGAIAQEEFESIPEQEQEGDDYYYFKVFEGEDEKNKLFIFRSDRKGINGEVTDIHKSPSLSGTEVITLLSQPLLEAIRPDMAYKNDDAVVKTIQVGKDEIKIYLSLLLPVVSETGSPNEGATLYGRYLFSPVDCTQLLFHNKKERATQDRFFYFAALDKVRNTTLSELRNRIFKNASTDQSLIDRLVTSYLPQGIVLQKGTVSHLGHAIFTKARAQKQDAVQKKAEDDLDSFYLTFLISRRLSKESSKEAKLYNVAISTLEQHFLWARSFADPSQNISFRQYKTLPARPFDDLVAQVTLTHTSNWDSVVKVLFKSRTKTHFRNDTEFVQVNVMSDKKLLAELERAPAVQTPEAIIRELCLLSTQASFKDDRSEVYWQLWITMKEDSETRYLEMQIVQLPDSYQLTLTSDHDKVVHFQANVGQTVEVKVGDEKSALPIVKRLAHLIAAKPTVHSLELQGSPAQATNHASWSDPQREATSSESVSKNETQLL